ncbi:MAG TPA: PilN domain-containing protein [Steroidobacteraceae bacterium]|nr:PilN domain-containing protein [Steroidobacteraceae bacterium]
MPRINLLPWREAQRKERKLAFLVALGVAVLAALVTTFAVYLMYDSMIAGRQRRNQLLRTQIKQLDKQIEEINSLETEKQRFIARMDVIEKLQRSRPGIVHVFDEIVKTLPDGVYLTGVQQVSAAGANKRLKFEGVAQSSTRVSSFMRNIDTSEWLRNPELEVVQTAKGPGSNFTLTADEVTAGGQEEPGKNPVGKGKIRKADLGGAGVQQ